MKQNGYGPEHRAAKTKKLEAMPTQKCEITGNPNRLECHHAVPKLFSGPDNPYNYQVLTSGFHAWLHHVCNVKDSKLVGQRLHLANFIQKHILSDQKVEIAKAQIEIIDRQLMTEYIDNLITKVAQEYKDIIALTLLSNFETIRDLKIENQRLQAKLNATSVSGPPAP